MPGEAGGMEAAGNTARPAQNGREEGLTVAGLQDLMEAEQQRDGARRSQGQKPGSGDRPLSHERRRSLLELGAHANASAGRFSANSHAEAA